MLQRTENPRVGGSIPPLGTIKSSTYTPKQRKNKPAKSAKNAVYEHRESTKRATAKRVFLPLSGYGRASP
jgi:hypothetical protein